MTSSYRGSLTHSNLRNTLLTVILCISACASIAVLILIHSVLAVFRMNGTLTYSLLLASLLTLIIVSIFAAHRRLRSRSLIFFPILTFITSCIALHFFDVDYLYLALHRSQYDKQVLDGPHMDGFQVFELGHAYNFPAGGVWHYIVYDQDDQITRPFADRAPAWNNAHSQYLRPFTTQCVVTVRHLESHYFSLLQQC